MTNDGPFTIGVEEEYQIVHPATRELRSRAHLILPEAQAALGNMVTPELYQSQIEIATSICHTVAEVRAKIGRLRGEVIAAAEKYGNQIVAAGTHPFSHWEDQQLTPKARYRGIAAEFQQLASEQLIFGCHVHIGISDRETAIRVMNRARPWLAPLLALAANSPFWLGVDTGYASFRTGIWRRWPMAGTPQFFASRAEYDALVDTLIQTGSISDATKIYWDVRPSARFETLEFRVTDVCLTIDEAVLIAGLSRAIARTCYDQAIKNEPALDVRPELLRAAKWRAARYGLEGELIDVVDKCAIPAPKLIEKLLATLRPALERYGEWGEINSLTHDTLARGNGATRQRTAYARRAQLEDVVDLLIAETAQGTK